MKKWLAGAGVRSKWRGKSDNNDPIYWIIY
jgi:hypothetical protein